MNHRIPILGIDAAFANTGLALAYYDVDSETVEVADLRLIKTEADKAGKKVVRKNSDDLRRAAEVIVGSDKALVDHQPAFAFAEVPTGAQSARAAWALGIAVGLIAHTASKVPLIQVTPKEVKDVTGEKFPDKAQMIDWAVRKHPNAPWPKRGGKIVAGQAEHLADAVAAIHAGLQTDEFRRAVSMIRVMRGVSPGASSLA